MDELLAELEELTGGLTRGWPIEREVRQLSLWLLEAFDAEPLPAEATELGFELRLPTRGGRVDSCEIDGTATDGDGEAVWPAAALSTTSGILTRLVNLVDPGALEECAGHLLASALEVIDADSMRTPARRLHARVGTLGWWLELDRD